MSDDTNHIEPKPCPFCGKTNAKRHCDHASGWIGCECGASGPRIKLDVDRYPGDSFRPNEEQKAVSAWNRRALSARASAGEGGDGRECDCGANAENKWPHHDDCGVYSSRPAQAGASGGGGLTFGVFRAANVARCIKWHPEGIASWSPSDWLTAVTGELGELASLLKMRNRERDGLAGNKFSPTDKMVADELADVLTYLDLLAEVLGVDLGRAAVDKFNEVSERVGFPDRITLTTPASPATGDAATWEEEIRRHDATPPAHGDGEGDDPFGDMPAPIGNPEAWPPNYADGYNDAVRNMVDSFPSVRARLTTRPTPEAQEARDAVDARRYRWLKNNFEFSFHRATCDYLVIAGETKFLSALRDENGDVTLEMDSVVDAALTLPAQGERNNG